MKRNTILAGCLGVIFACNGAEGKNKESQVPYAEDSITGHTMGTNSPLISGERVGQSPEEIEEEVAADAPKEDIQAAGTVAMEEATSDPDQEELQAEPITIILNVVPDEMKFDKDVFSVTAGAEVIIELENLDGMQHNMLISKPGSLDKVGAAADAMVRDPKAAAKHYVPEIEEVLFATDMLNPGDFATLKFIAPKEPGDYPFVCTFPGHWRMMNGIMKVTAP